MDFDFYRMVFLRLMDGVPLMLELAFISMAIGLAWAIVLVAMARSGVAPLAWFAKAYIFVFRGTPLLVQLFLIFYGLAQFPAVRQSVFWPFLRDPFWCAILAFSLNTAAYTAEIMRGGLQAVPLGQVEAARASGMRAFVLYRDVIIPQAIRQALPAYGTEIILMTRATALGSVITLMEITGIAQKLGAETFRYIEIFLCAGALYLLLNFILTRLVDALEYWLTPDLRAPAFPLPKPVGLPQ